MALMGVGEAPVTRQGVVHMDVGEAQVTHLAVDPMDVGEGPATLQVITDYSLSFEICSQFLYLSLLYRSIGACSPFLTSYSFENTRSAFKKLSKL